MKKLIITGLLTLFTLPAFAQQNYATPEKAASAFAKALTTQDDNAINQVLGDNWRQYLPQREDEPEAVARFLRDWEVGHQIDEQGDTAHLNVGSDGWQLPIPIVKTAKGWRFDMAGGQDEIQTREIGRNELSAIQAIHAYVDAQNDYYQRFQHYAAKLLSSEGQKNGLYWPTGPGEEPSPLGPAYSPTLPDAGYHGYRFRIIADQDRQGFALIAWPVKFAETGIMSFIVDQNDTVYQANLGMQSALKAAEVKAFTRDKPWDAMTQ